MPHASSSPEKTACPDIAETMTLSALQAKMQVWLDSASLFPHNGLDL
jgi:hypothetical protein